MARPKMPRELQGRRKPKNAGRAIARILSYMEGQRLKLFIVFIGIVISSLAGVAGTYFLKPVINSVEESIKTTGTIGSDFFIKIAIMALVYAIGVIGAYVYSRLMLDISTETLRKIRVDMFAKLKRLPIKYFDTHVHGETMSRFTNDTDTLREMISQGIPQIFSSCLTIIGVFVLMLYLSPILTLLVAITLVAMFFILKIVTQKSSHYFRRQQKEIGKVNGYIEEMIEGQKVVKVFCHEKGAKERFAGMNEELFEAAANAHTFGSVLGPISGNFSYMNYAITATAGAALVLFGFADIGTVAAFLQSTRSFFQPITQITQQFNSVISALAGAERIFELIDEEEEIDEGTVELVSVERKEDGSLCETDKRTGVWAWKDASESGEVKYTELRGDVRFDDVVFGYTDEKTVLKGVSLYAKPGQKIALVGSTGAGKTTITNLINRFYDIPSGEITYDGVNIKRIKKNDLRSSLGMVLQDTHLFGDTVMENIRYGKLDATDEEVVAAAKLANAHSFITHLPEGYNTQLTADGVNLSQGQRQLIAIARAAIADPPVLILDEATSSIDTRTEALIEKGMDTLMCGRTVFVIAHRLSTVRNSHAIMVIENGEIIERGAHEELLALRGKYYQLYTGMFELE